MYYYQGAKNLVTLIMSIIIEVIIILLLILFNGFLSITEFALVSSRKGRLEEMAGENIAGAEIALEILSDPSTFHSAIKIGSTFLFILTGAYAGVSFVNEFAYYFVNIPVIAPYKEIISLVVIVVIITFFSIVLGDLIPKRIGLTDPEHVAILTAKPVLLLLNIIRPAIKLTSGSTDYVLRLTGTRNRNESGVTEEEITSLLEEGTRAGIFEESEQEIVQSVFRFADRDVASVMVPRPDIIALDLLLPFEELKAKIIETGHSRYPVYKHELDEISGVISVRDLWVKMASGISNPLSEVICKVLIVPESLSTLKLLEMFRSAVSPLAVVVDEYGSVLGIVTLHDLMEAIVGDLDSVDRESGDPDVVEREDGSWFVVGTYAVIDLKTLLHLNSLPGEDIHHFRTLGGYLMAELGRIPRTGDTIEYGGYKFEVADMDGQRIDKILITFQT